MSIKKSAMRKRALVALLCAAPALAFAETGSVVRATQLVDRPYSDATSLGVVRAEQAVDIIERRGGWYQVATDDGRKGWLRLSSIRLGKAAQEEEGGGFWASLFSFTGRSQARTASATTGIRGLSEEEIQSAAPNAAAVARLAQFAPSDDEARAYAQEIGLEQRDVKPLPAKKKGGGK